MKSDRRHQLQHNQLADAIGDWTVKLKPYARLIGGLIVLLVVAVVAYGYVTARNQEQIVIGWDEYLEAFDSQDRERLLQVAQKYDGTSVAPVARIAAADLALSEGCQRLFRNKANARDTLGQAVDNYQTVLRIAQDEVYKQRALFGLGRAHEALGSLEDLNKAREDYKKLIADFPKGVYRETAETRLADIDRSSTKEFYDWFAKYQPPMQSSPSGKKPEFLEETLDGDLKGPTMLDELNLGSPKTESAEQGLDDLDLPSTTEGDKTQIDDSDPLEKTQGDSQVDGKPGATEETPSEQDSKPSTPNESSEKSAK